MCVRLAGHALVYCGELYQFVFVLERKANAAVSHQFTWLCLCSQCNVACGMLCLHEV